MTQPSPDDTKSPADKPDKGKAAAAPPLALLELVVFEHHDPILGRSHRAVGVVVGVDDQGVTVRPLAHHDVRVAPGDAERYDDAGDVDPTS